MLAPALSSRVNAPLRQIAQNLNRPLPVGAGGARVPSQPTTPGGPLTMFLGRKRGNNNEDDDWGLNQKNRKEHTSSESSSTKDKHENAGAHGGRRNIPPNPNKRN
ncbi:hypothetical protein ACFOY2_32245 [Nonomuraea purpurea]|uniref:Uncharacterized protein n=1 Tax=Nonomuraea purpurea TaxID=1849276 RepID=A0ABV8GD96_9ACTN